MPLFIGIDIGTQGVRVVMLDEQGNQIGLQKKIFSFTGDLRVEQSPLLWWQDCKDCLRALTTALSSTTRSSVVSITVTSTSGTIIPIGKNHNPLHNAIMYSDDRQGDAGTACRSAAEAARVSGYSAFNSSSGLAKMKWFLETFPERRVELWRFVHAADFINGRLCANYEVTDYSNALKSGYDLHRKQWPDYIETKLGIDLDFLPGVVSAGSTINSLDPTIAAELGLSRDVKVVAGMTDGCASQVAAGAVSPGDWNTTIGTTLVIKGVTNRPIIDESGAIYNHLHPNGYWMPGGASNTGADWVTRLFGNADLTEMDRRTSVLLPTNELAWPLMQTSERFPFFASEIRGFWPTTVTPERLFASCMEGVSFIERLAYERISTLSGESISEIFSAGGASSSETWMQLRSDVLDLPVKRMKHVSGAVGAAIIAASQTHFHSLREAANTMTQVDKTFYPQPEFVARYHREFERFLLELKKRKIINPDYDSYISAASR